MSLKRRAALALQRLLLRTWLLLGADARALACAERITQGHPDDVHALATQAHLLATQQRLAQALCCQMSWAPPAGGSS